MVRQFCDDSPFFVDFEPVAANSDSMITSARNRLNFHRATWHHAHFAAFIANVCGAVLEGRRPVVGGLDDYSPFSVGKTVFVAHHNSHKSVRKLISPIIETGNTAYDNVAFPVYIHPAMAHVIF